LPNAQQKVLCNWGLTLQQSSAVHIQALVSADGILLVISSLHQLLIINLASVPGGQLVNSPTAQSLVRYVQADDQHIMTTEKANRFLIILFILTLFPTMAFANAGSPMMWFGMFHSLILNAVIGVTESEIVRKFKIPNRAWLIVIANYVSMLIGLNYIAPHFSTISGNYDFWGGQTNYGAYELKGFFAGMTASFCATLIIELPFFFFAVKDKLLRKKIFIPFFVANFITNIVMTLVYYLIVKGGGHW